MSDDDSSSDGEPMLSSPEPSDDESAANDNDVFKFTARKFQKVNNDDSPPSAMRKRRHQVDAVEEKLSLMEREEQARDQKLRDRLHGRSEDEDDDDDDSSDDDDVVEILDAPSSRTSNVATRRTAPLAIDVDSDDDSDDDDDAKPVNFLRDAPKEVLEVLQRSQLATNRLKQAQQYHAEDVHVRVQETHIEMPLRTRPTTNQPACRPKPVKLGKPLRLTCRCQTILNGTKQPTDEKSVITHQNQLLSSLMENVMSAFSLPSTARVTLTFDGRNMDLKRTPTFYEIEDEDLIDVTANVIAMPKNVTTSAAPKFKLTLRSKNGKKIQETSMLLGKNENFKNLLDRYRSKENRGGKSCSFSFDGETLNLNRTPSSYDMEDEDLIDVIWS